MTYPLHSVAWLLMCASISAFAAQPSSVVASYDVYKGGIKLAQIDEIYTRQKDHYTLFSTTRPVGLLAIFKPGKILIKSDGLVNSQGLRPLHFSDLREKDESRNRSAEFDWNKGKLTLINHEEQREFPLQAGTQDRLSAMYQFMFLSLAKSDSLSFHMTNGNKIDIYNYHVTPNQTVSVPLGKFKGLYVASVPEADASRTEIWLVDNPVSFPYKMVITDKDGEKFSQELTKFEWVP
jgi:hypothetical protein